MAEVRFKNVNKIYGKDTHIVKDCSLDIRDGEFMVFVGPSGCGKSTTLRMLAGLEEITSGEVLIGDTVVNDILPKERNIAMVFQNYALYPHMSVYDNMAFGLKLAKMPQSEIDDRVAKAAKILSLEDLLQRKPSQLSGGQRQRVALGRAIVRDPKVFLFDEPLSNLDAKLRVQMRAEITKLHQRLKTTVVYVTHDQTEAMTMGDRITVLHLGYVQQVDTPIKLYNNPINMFVAGFIGSPSMNFLKGKLVQKKKEWIFEASGVSYKPSAKQMEKIKNYKDREIVLGLRPEHLTIATKEADVQVKANISVIEPMGNEMVIYLERKNTDEVLLARILSDESIKRGGSIELSIAKNSTHFFDPDTEKSLTFAL